MCGKELKGRRGLTNHMEIRKNEKNDTIALFAH